MLVSKSDLISWANDKGLRHQGFNDIEDYYYLANCLPMDEQDKLAENVHDIKTEKQEKTYLYNIFGEWDIDYINGFCISIIDRIIIGYYIYLSGLMEIDIGLDS